MNFKNNYKTEAWNIQHSQKSLLWHTDAPITFKPQRSSTSSGKMDTSDMSANSWWQWVWMYFSTLGSVGMTVSLWMGVLRNSRIVDLFSLSIPLRVNTSIFPSHPNTFTVEKSRACRNSEHSLQQNMPSCSVFTGTLKWTSWDFKKLHVWSAEVWDREVTTTLQSDTVYTAGDPGWFRVCNSLSFTSFLAFLVPG